MVVFNKQARCKITKYPQPDCQEIKWEVGVSGAHKLTHGKENQPCFSAQ